MPQSYSHLTHPSHSARPRNWDCSEPSSRMMNASKSHLPVLHPRSHPPFLFSASQKTLASPSSSRSPFSFSPQQRKHTLQSFRIHATASAAKEEGGNPNLDEARETFVVTTPLYYVNAAPHMGSAYPTIAADSLARFQRLRGRKVVFVTGTDEHGEKIATSAAAAGRSPKEHCDIVALEYQGLWNELDIKYDRFVRTTNESHEKIVREFFQRVWDSGDIYRAEYEGLYCVNCEEYKDEKELLEGNVCGIHQKPCQHRREDNFFFRLTRYQEDLERLLDSNPDFVRPSLRRNEVLGWVKDGLRDFSISRAAVEWGIPVPPEPKQTIYVWFDALLGYVSALLEAGEESTLANAAARGWPASVHIIGKDILRFHAVYWPAMLLSGGLPIPHAVFGHGFLTKDGMKMGKSLGNTLEPKDLVARFGSDAVRFYFLKEIEFGKDGDFAEERFVNIINASLANTVGNLLNRTLGLLKQNCTSTIPIDTNEISEQHSLRILTTEAAEQAARDYEQLQFGAACDAALRIGSAGNLFIDEKAPWAEFKKGPEEAASAAKDLATVLEAMRVMAVVLSPIVPRLSRSIYIQLGFSESDFQNLSWEATKWGGLKAGDTMPEPKPVFLRIGDLDAPKKGAVQPKAKQGGKKQGSKSEKKKAKQSAPEVPQVVNAGKT